ncbi:hypothetical protein QFC21_003508 [Naganishia friedmannii]|uniref:Uncharacterized protein n=1 Tax=Naganishia friedmannii TaxID=89922 RepID=A0ACC2VNB2_9TREE|nr:hypothetical protein QFC21_003508 [Naganishia friedmannii]
MSAPTAAAAAVTTSANDDADLPSVSITMLGAGQEVGRSCCVIKHRGKVVVCDVGLHPANNGLSALPFIDELDWSTVDAILVTHFHVDHAAGLPYVMEKTNFKEGKGKVYMTHPTKAIFRLTMQDAVRIGNNSDDANDRLYTEEDLNNAWQNIIAVDYHQDIAISSALRFTPYHAGHVLGAAMFMIQIAGLNILYTGDYSREEDRHLVSAEVPPIRPDIMICESTFGVHTLPPRKEKEEQFTTLVSNIVRRGGRCLMPISAFGNVQELLLILDEYWDAHPELHAIPVLYASGLAFRGMQVYRTYIHTMNDRIKSRFSANRNENPFAFKYVRNLKDFRKWHDDGPCVMMATPQMLQGAHSRELLEKWAPDRKNGLIVTGYSIEGTMAKNLLKQPEDFLGMRGQKIQRRMTVDEISFSAHVDFAQNSSFIKQVNPQHIVLVHGEASVMGRLRLALQSQYADSDVKIHTPRNCEPLTLTFNTERVIKVIGSLATKHPKPTQPLSGLLVQKDYSYTLLDPKDLKDFTGLGTTEIKQRQTLRLSVGWEVVRWHLEGMYGEVEEESEGGKPVFKIMQAVNVIHSSEQELTLEWVSSVSNDMIADSVLALLCGIDSNYATIKLTSKACDHGHETEKESYQSSILPTHPHPHSLAAKRTAPTSDSKESSSRIKANPAIMTDIQQLRRFLLAHFGNVSELVEEEQEGKEDELLMLKVEVDQHVATIDLMTMIVTCKNPALRKRIVSVLQMAQTTISTLSSSFRSTSYTLAKPETTKADLEKSHEGVMKNEVMTDAGVAVKMEA